MDPSKGIIKLNLKEFECISTGIFLLFHPLLKLPLFPKPKKVSNILKEYLLKNKKIIIKIIILSIFTTSIGILFGYYIKLSSSLLEKYQRFKYIINISIFYILLVILKNVFELLKNKQLLKFNINVSDDLYSFFIEKLYILPLNFIKSKTTGEIITRFNELSLINEIIPSIIICFIIDLITIIIALVASFVISSSLTLIVLLFMFLYIIISCLLIIRH